MYLVISPADSILFHPANSVYDFVTELPQEIDLSGKWVCGLVECNLDPSPKALYVYSDIVQNSVVQGKLNPMLKIITEKGQFSHVYYFPVSRDRLHRIKIQVRTEEGKLPNSNISNCFMVLHFKRIK